MKSRKKIVPQHGADVSANYHDIPILSVREWVKKAHPEDYLEKICTQIDIKNDQERQTFCKRIPRLAERYVELMRANPPGMRPSAQNKLLDQYKNSIYEAQSRYKTLLDVPAIRTKIERAMRKKFEEGRASNIRELLKPYCDETGLSIALIEQFFGVLAELAENAKDQGIGKDKADPSQEFLTLWIAAIARVWPKDAALRFVRGKRIPELNEYKSRSIPIVHGIVSRIEPRITKKEIENIMRKVITNRLADQPVALFFLP